MKKKSHTALLCHLALYVLFLTVLSLHYGQTTWAKGPSLSIGKNEIETRVLHSATNVPLDGLAESPKNLARWNMGASLSLWQSERYEPVSRQADVKGDISNLLSQDFTSTWQAAPGEYSLSIDLSEVFLVDHATLEVFSGSGKLQWYTADSLLPPNHSRWRNLGEQVDFAGAQTIRVSGGPNQARFILLKLQIDTPTLLNPIGLFGNLGLADVAPAPASEARGSTDAESPNPNTLSDIAAFYAGGRVLWVSDPEKADISNVMLADEVDEGVDFSAQDEAIWVVALAEDREIAKTSVKLEAPPGELSAYLMSSLPEEWLQEFGELSWYAPDGSLQPLLLADTGGITLPSGPIPSRSQVLLAAEIFSSLTPAFVVETNPDEKMVEVMIPQINARYVLFRWTPAPGSGGNGQAFKVIRVAVYTWKPEDEAGYRRTDTFRFAADNLANSGITGGAPTGNASGEVPYIPVVSP